MSMVKIKFHANWCSDEDIREHFNRCTIYGDYSWKDLYLSLDDDYDFYIVMNYPRHNHFDPTKTIIFQSEPQYTRKMWGQYYKPDKNLFFKVFDTESFHNVDKWYINMNYQQLINNPFSKTRVMSGIISRLNFLEGHGDRLNFLNYIDRLPYYEHFGKGDFRHLRSFKGTLLNKEDGLIPYRYHFNAENSYERNYFTEKIIDPILCECLCFYDGCPNLEDFINAGAYIKINLKDPQEAFDIIQESISNHIYEKRIETIRMEKHRLMNEMNPLNIIHKIINGSD